MNLAYKVVSRQNDQLVSALGGDLPSDWVLTYTPGQETVPKQGRIFVFQTLEAAVKWALVQGLPLEIWQCEYKDSLETPSLCALVLWKERLAEYWEHYHAKSLRRSLPFVNATPQGTAFASSVTLTTRVPETVVSDLHQRLWIHAGRLPVPEDPEPDL